MSFKVAFIGAGSIGFTRRLLADILTVPEFRDIEVAFTDINPDNLSMVTQLCQRDIDENGLNIKIHSTLNRREVFQDAKYVVNCVRIGMLEAFATDVEIPLKYGGDILKKWLNGSISVYGFKAKPVVIYTCVRKDVTGLRQTSPIGWRNLRSVLRPNTAAASMAGASLRPWKRGASIAVT